MLEQIRARGCSKENSEHVCMHRLITNNSFISTSDIHRWEYHLVYQRSRVSLPIWSCQSHAEQRKRRQTTFAIFVWSSGPGNLLRSHGSCSPSQVHPSSLRPLPSPHAQPPQPHLRSCQWSLQFAHLFTTRIQLHPLFCQLLWQTIGRTKHSVQQRQQKQQNTRAVRLEKGGPAVV